jgi:mycofactocin precursor
MTQQAVIEAAPDQPTLTAGAPAGPDPTDGTADTADTAGDEALVADELLVEEVSIDGMCGVY